MDKKQRLKSSERQSSPQKPDLKRQALPKVVVGRKKPASSDGHRRLLSLVKDSKGLSSSQYDDEDESFQSGMMAARYFVDPMLVYRFRMASTGSIQTSVAGVAQGYINLDPSGFTGSEYTSLSALFDYVRLVRAKLTVIAINPHSDGYATGRINAQIFFSCDGGKINTNPSNAQAVIECPNTLLFSTGEPKPQSISYNPPSQEWALTSSPVPGPFAGCYGEFQYYTSGLTVSTYYCTWLLEGEYEFTSRT